MPNILDATGLQTSTRAELIAFFTAQFQAIYGTDIDLSSDSPDGQLMNIFVQAQLDVQDLLVQIYNTFNPDNAIGVTLDQRVSINGIQRQAGTYTVTPITVVLSQSVNLYGLDQTAEPVYTISDNAGTLWVLQTTQLGLLAGTHVLTFQAAVPGAQLTIPNTINVQVSIVLGVTSVNNPTTYTTLGVNAESDAALKLRRQRSVSITSQGYLKGLLAALQNIPGVSSAFVYENTGDTTDGDGIPGHSIWVIVAGSGTASAIANAIYTKRNAGCGLFGDTDFTITQVDGTPFVVSWDEVVVQNAFIAFTVASLNGTNPPNIAAIKAGLVANFVPGVNEKININQVATIAQQADPNTLVTGPGLSAAHAQTLSLSGPAASGTFTLRYNGNVSASIAYNESTPSIQTKVQAIPGLSAALVTGSMGTGILNFNLAAIADVESLITVATNTLLTAAPSPVTFAYNEGYGNTLTPTTKKNQLVVAADNIIILPMQLSPVGASVPTGGPLQFTPLGGYGPYTFSLSVNASGGSINATTGLYTAGGSTGTDTVQVVDALGNQTTTNVTVT